MSRYIDVDELIFIGIDNPDDDNLFEFVPREFIDNAPTADVQPVVRGEWIWQPKTETQSEGWKCSACNIGYHTHVPYFGEFNYCPNCGARMVEE